MASEENPPPRQGSDLNDRIPTAQDALDLAQSRPNFIPNARYVLFILVKSSFNFSFYYFFFSFLVKLNKWVKVCHLYWVNYRHFQELLQ